MEKCSATAPTTSPPPPGEDARRAGEGAPRRRILHRRTQEHRG
jgi:hypothetical protein